MSLRWCAQNYLGTKYLLRQSQSQTQIQFHLLCLQDTWNLICVLHLEVRPRDLVFDPAVNSTFNVKNWFIHFFCHESTQIGEYNLGLLAHHHINREEKRRKTPMVVAVLSILVLLPFLPPGGNLSITSDFQVSTSAFPILASTIASDWRSHRPWIYMSPCVSIILPAWRTPPSDLLRPC